MRRYQQLAIKQLVSKFIDGSLSPEVVADNALKETDKFRILNAFIRTTPDLAREQARQSAYRYERKKQLGSLDGVPIALKDNFCTKDVQTTCASKMLENFMSPYNATVYDRLLNAGAVLIGKTNMDEFAMGSGTVDSIFGPTKNVWSANLSTDNWNISGGSSGGSATAVAAGICYAAIGSDTGGSTRNPASYCGVVGLKPSYGLVSRFGLIPLVNSMDTPGILTRTVDDCAIVLNAIAGPDSRDSTMILESYEPIELPAVDRIHIRNIRIGIPKEYYCARLSTEVANVWKEVGDMLDAEGANVREISMPNTKYCSAVYSVLNQSDIASNMARYDGIKYGHRADVDTTYEEYVATTRNEGFNDVVKERILMGNFFLLRENYNTYYEKAMRIRRLIAEDFNHAFVHTNVDVILTPTTLTEAPYYRDFVALSNQDQCAMQDFCTLPANMAGIPALSLPVRLSEHGLPISLQLMSQCQNERVLLTVAKWMEAKFNFYKLQSNHIHKIRE